MAEDETTSPQAPLPSAGTTGAFTAGPAAGPRYSATGQPAQAAPSLLAGRTSPGQGDQPSSRILASLEGRAPQPEPKHLAPKRASSWRGPVLLLLLLLFCGGAALWFTLRDRAASVVVAGNTPAPPVPPAPAAAAPQGAVKDMGKDISKDQDVLQDAGKNASASAPAPDKSAQAAAGKPGDTPLSAAASIVDDRPATAGQDDDDQREPANPLSMLAPAAPASGKDASHAAAHENAVKPAGKDTSKTLAADAKDAKGAGKDAKHAPAKTAHTGSSKKVSDSDAALLSALMSYGLPPPHKTDFARVMPGTPLAERLKECRRLAFLESEQCRLQVCSGQWGIAPECPNPQAHSEP